MNLAPNSTSNPFPKIHIASLFVLFEPYTLATGTLWNVAPRSRHA